MVLTSSGASDSLHTGSQVPCLVQLPVGNDIYVLTLFYPGRQPTSDNSDDDNDVLFYYNAQNPQY